MTRDTLYTRLRARPCEYPFCQAKAGQRCKGLGIYAVHFARWRVYRG